MGTCTKQMTCSTVSTYTCQFLKLCDDICIRTWQEVALKYDKMCDVQNWPQFHCLRRLSANSSILIWTLALLWCCHEILKKTCVAAVLRLLVDRTSFWRCRRAELKSLAACAWLLFRFKSFFLLGNLGLRYYFISRPNKLSVWKFVRADCVSRL